MKNHVIVTGGCGFIGSALCEILLKNYNVINIDSLTYAGSLKNTKKFKNNLNYLFFKLNINNPKIEKIIKKYKPKYIINCAAETHVDNSIKNPKKFLTTNVMATYDFFLMSMKYWMSKDAPASFKFLHVSTDEVFGSLNKSGIFNEKSNIKPSSPYSASKASSDLLGLSLFKTYKFPIIVTNCSNNFGPRQHHEKLIPTIIRNLIKGNKIPIYGDGKNIRDWLYVYDHADALIRLCRLGVPGERYCIGGNFEKTNIDLVKIILKYKEYFNIKNPSLENTINFVKDRLGHDFRYAINNSKIKKHTGWRPSKDFSEKIFKTIKYYLKN